MRSSKESFFTTPDSGLLNKQFWKFVKSNSKSNRIPESVYFKDSVRNSSEEKANLFNSYFISQFSSASDYDIDFSLEGDNMQPITTRDEIFSILKQLDTSKAPGPDQLHPRVLKCCANSLAFPLSKLFNQSYNSGILPDDWKVASIVPFFKKGDSRDVSNYRPISLTSCVIKVFERVVHKEILGRCGHLLDERQHGFLKSKSCTTQLLSFTDHITCNTRDRCYDVVYFDFSKAFDSVSHDIILRKLKTRYGLDGRLLRFILNYLKDRKQKVVVDGESSELGDVLSGVPQGSILGPLLFILFIDDIVNEVTPGSFIILYADDTKIWRHIRNVSDILTLQQTIDNLADWATRNKMAFHPAKCKVLRVNGNCVQRPPNIPYTLHGQQLEVVTTHRDLGVLISSDSTWADHLSMKLTEVTNRLSLTRLTCSFISSENCRRTLYLTMIRSLLDHASPIWAPQYPTHVDSFERVQKSAIKWIGGVPNYTSYSKPYYLSELARLNILPIKHFFMLNDLKIMYKIINGLIPVSLPPHLCVLDASHPLRFTRGSASIINSTDRTRLCSSIPNGAPNIVTHSYFSRIVSMWNSTPVNIRQAENYDLFIVSIKDYLWTLNPWPD